MTVKDEKGEILEQESRSNKVRRTSYLLPRERTKEQSDICWNDNNMLFWKPRGKVCRGRMVNKLTMKRSWDGVQWGCGP